MTHAPVPSGCAKHHGPAPVWRPPSAPGCLLLGRRRLALRLSDALAGCRLALLGRRQGLCRLRLLGGGRRQLLLGMLGQLPSLAQRGVAILLQLAARRQRRAVWGCG